MNGKKSLTPLNIDKYCDYYLDKFYRQNEPSPFTLEDYENFKYLVKTLNNFAVENSSQNTKRSYLYLTKANKLSKILWKRVKHLTEDLEVIKTAAKLRSLTLNNLGCHFKACDKLSASLEFLEKATIIEKKGAVEDYEIATTLLNLTAVLSKLGNHELALQNSLEATRILEKVDEEREITEALSTSYFNHAVELEYLHRNIEAKVFYEKAYELCKEKLGENHQSTQNFLEKLVQFNLTHSAISSAPSSLPANSSKSQNSFFSAQKELKTLEISYTAYKVFGGIRFKIFVLNKKDIASFKVLAFPKNKYPVYRMICDYNKLAEICENEECKNLAQSTQEEVQECAKQLMELIVIEKGALKVARCNQSFNV